MSDDLARRGIQYFVLVDGNGVSPDGTTLSQLRQRGLSPICEVNSSGVAASGASIQTLRQRGIPFYCSVSELGVALDMTTKSQLEMRGIPYFCPVDSLGAADTPAYLGQTATHCFVPSTKNASTAIWNGRSGHIARDTIINPIVYVANWYVTAGTGEVNIGATASKSLSIEYPAGSSTVYQGTVLGVANPTVADGSSTGFSVPVTIPKGAAFRVFQSHQSAGGVPLCFSGNPTQNTAFGDGTNNSGVDQTMTPAAFTSNVTSVMPALAIVSQTRLPSIFAPGTSRMVGTLDATVDATGDTGYARMFGGSFAYMNYGVNGDTTVSLVASRAKRFAMGAFASHMWLDAGPNDLNVAGRTAAQILADIATLTALWPAKSKVILDTCMSFTTSTDGWITTANQTAPTWEAARNTLNTGILALTGYNQIIDVTTFQGNGTSNVFWNNPAVGGFQFTTDGKHAITAAATGLRDSGLFNPLLVQYP